MDDKSWEDRQDPLEEADADLPVSKVREEEELVSRGVTGHSLHQCPAEHVGTVDALCT